MKTRAISAAMLIIAVLGTRASTAAKQPLIVVHGNTVIAFFCPVSDKMDQDAGTNEALSDFQHYAARSREPLKKAGIDFQEVYAHSFRVRTGQSVTIFRTSKVEVGYYFIAPGKKPRVEYGVMTDIDLFDAANEYFGTAIH